MTIEVLGIDLAKNVFQLHGVDRKGNAVFKRRVMRDQLLSVLAGIERCTIAIEACTGAFCWARQFEALGHKVKIVSPQYVKPFVRRQKNDGNDAEAICTAVRQPHIPLVPKKSVEQQDIQALHRARQRLVNHRTAVVSQMRGLLLDRGIAFAKSITRARRMIPEILSRADSGLSPMARDTIAELWDFLCDLDRRIASFDRKIEAVFKASEPCKRVARIKGVGPKNRYSHCCSSRRRLGLQEWAPYGSLAWLGTAPVFERRQGRTHGHLQARESAPTQLARTRRTSSCQNGCQQERSHKPMGQRASGAARFQPRNGCHRQQERTDNLGRASNGR